MWKKKKKPWKLYTEGYGVPPLRKDLTIQLFWVLLQTALWEGLSKRHSYPKSCSLPLGILHPITSQCFDIKDWFLTLTQNNSEEPCQFQKLHEVVTAQLHPLPSPASFPAPTGKFSGQQYLKVSFLGKLMCNTLWFINSK